MDVIRPVISELNERSREIFRLIVENYLETGDPVGSRTLARQLNSKISPATIRNVMADLEEGGLLLAPHTSAGRLPTEAGLRLFVDGLLEIGNLSQEERAKLESQVAGSGKNLETLLEEATTSLSGLSHLAGLVFAPTSDTPLKHVEFVSLSPGKALVVIITGDGVVENRLLQLPPDIPASALVEATNYLSARLVGRTFPEARREIAEEIAQKRARIDEISAKIVEAGLATWGGGEKGGTLIVRGQAHLLDDVTALTDLERVRTLFNALEAEEMMLRLLELSDNADGVQIFIGADNQLFSMSGCSIVIAPYRSSQRSLVGAVGVIGPSRMNYARIIPMVDYTAKLIGKAIG
jgi:heat-inducible transcriptional repressor